MESVLIEALAMVAGAIMALLFLTSLKEHFGKNATTVLQSIVPTSDSVTSGTNSVNPAMEHLEEKAISSFISEEPESSRTANRKNLIDQFTDWIFPKSVKTRAENVPPEQKNKRRILLIMHYIFIFISIISMMLLPFTLNGFGLVTAALYVILANLAQRKGSFFALFCSILVAGYCVFQILASLAFFIMASSSRNAIYRFLIYYAVLFFLFLLEIITYKFVLKYDVP